MPRPTLHSLTGLRFLAALHVVLFHLGFSRLSGLPDLLGRFIEEGEVAVSLFFVLSGFVLTYRYFGIDETPLTRQRFLVARVARVYPMYLVGLAAALPWYLQGTSGQLAGAIAGGALVVVGLQAWLPQIVLAWNFPSWSLSNEAFFYAVYLRVLKLFQNQSRRWLIVAIAVLWALGQIPPVAYGLVKPTGALWWNFVAYFPLFRLPEFLIGVAAGILFMRDNASSVPGRGAAYSLIATSSSLAIAFGVSGLPPLLTDSNAFLGPVFALLTYGLALGTGPIDVALRHPFTVGLGNASYAMYLLHVPVARFGANVANELGVQDPPGSWGFLISAAVAVVLISLPVHRYIERPARRVITDWGRSLEAGSARSSP